MLAYIILIHKFCIHHCSFVFHVISLVSVYPNGHSHHNKMDSKFCVTPIGMLFLWLHSDQFFKPNHNFLFEKETKTKY